MEGDMDWNQDLDDIDEPWDSFSESMCGDETDPFCRGGRSRSRSPVKKRRDSRSRSRCFV